MHQLNYPISDVEAQGLAELLTAAFPKLTSLDLRCEWPPAFMHSLARGPPMKMTRLLMGPYLEFDDQDSRYVCGSLSLCVCVCVCTCVCPPLINEAPLCFFSKTAGLLFRVFAYMLATRHTLSLIVIV